LIQLFRLVCILGACLVIRAEAAGTLAGNEAPAPTAVNLSAEGTLDWAHWGLNSETDFDQKAGGTNQISNFSPITGAVANSVSRFDDAAAGFSWTDGSPTESAVLTTTGIYVPGLTNGFELTVPAGTTTSVLKVYAGAWNAKLHFEAALSDASAAPYVDESLNAAGVGQAVVYTLRFAANSPGQKLTVKAYSSALNDPDGNCTLMAASLGVPPAGNLSGLDSLLPSGAVINLSSEGTVDWAHWGLATATDFNHKAGAAAQISNVTPIGAEAASQTSTALATYVWTGGSPTATSSNTAAIFVAGQDNGFQFTVPADTSTRVLRVYVSAFSARVHFEAALSDASAPVLSDDSFDATENLQAPVRVYSVSYAATSAGQTLTVKISVLMDEGSGWVSLQAATLQTLPAQTGVLGGGYTVLATASTINLTEEGKLDWAHWGTSAAADVDRKAGGTNVISAFNVIGLDDNGVPLEVQQFGDNFTAYSWSDGTPTLAVLSSGTGIYLAQPGASSGPGLNSGFEISVPADKTVRALKVYVGAYAARMHFEAMLSDGSALPYVDDSFFNESDGPNRVYTLTFAAATSGQKLIVRWWTSSLVDTDWGNVTLQSAVVREAAPVVSLLTPANGSIFNPASSGVHFTASTIDPFSIASNQVGMTLNGMNLSSALAVSGSGTARSVLYSNLAPNQLYSGQIWAVDNLGNATTNFVTFDTFSTNGAVVIEVEDYNYDSGQFQDNPAPGAYADHTGTPEIDYYTLNSGGGAYRPIDTVQIVDALETRTYFAAAGVQNHAVRGWSAEDWLNFTRSFPNARYNVYLRYTSLTDQTLDLGLVTSARTQAGQTVTPLGRFIAPQVNSDAIYRYAALTDTNGSALAVPLSGVQTLRLTATDTTGDGLIADFFILAPAASSQQPRISVSASNGQITVSFPTQIGSSYTLEYKDKLDATAWQSISPSVPGDGSVKSISQPTAGLARFYRLRVQ
jgi:hypothetical protein